MSPRVDQYLTPHPVGLYPQVIAATAPTKTDRQANPDGACSLLSPSVRDGVAAHEWKSTQRPLRYMWQTKGNIWLIKGNFGHDNCFFKEIFANFRIPRLIRPFASVFLD